MAAYYFDSSALVKLYLLESGTDLARSLLDPRSSHDLFVIGLAEIEVIAAIVRRIHGGSISPDDGKVAIERFRSDLSDEFTIVDVTDSQIASAIALVGKHRLRAYDAIHLAACIGLNQYVLSARNEALTLVSADQELNAAAVLEGIPVLDPNTR